MKKFIGEATVWMFTGLIFLMPLSLMASSVSDKGFYYYFAGYCISWIVLGLIIKAIDNGDLRL